MEDKSVRISEESHKKLFDYTSQYSVLKMNKLADIAIKSWLESDEKAKIISIVKYGKSNQEHG